MDINAHKKQFGKQAENYTKYRKPYCDRSYFTFEEEVQVCFGYR